MRTQIQINSISTIKTKKGQQTILDIKLLEGNILIGTVYKNTKDSISFKITGIGLENKKFDKESISVLIEIIDFNKTENIVDQFFISE